MLELTALGIVMLIIQRIDHNRKIRKMLEQYKDQYNLV